MRVQIILATGNNLSASINELEHHLERPVGAHHS